MSVLLFFFFFNDTATTEIYTLSLHDALPISYGTKRRLQSDKPAARGRPADRARTVGAERERSQSRGHCSRAAAARSARGAFEVPGIARRAERRPVGQPLHA